MASEVAGSAEVVPISKPRRERRRWSAQEKRRVLREAAACSAPGELGELLRREGLYHSNLAQWRAQFEREGLAGLSTRSPGRKPKHDEKDLRIAQLEREKVKLERELRISRGLIELQKKAQEILQAMDQGGQS